MTIDSWLDLPDDVGHVLGALRWFCSGLWDSTRGAEFIVEEVFSSRCDAWRL